VKRACVLLRTSSHYRRDAFAAGLARLGFSIEEKFQRRPAPEDLLVLWNRNRGYESIAEIYERAGAKLIIAENGYLPGPEGGKTYALALNRHNGAGNWPVGPDPRRTFELQPWRTSGRHIVILPQRGIGQAGVAMPNQWLRNVIRRLQAVTDRPLVIRRHPGPAKSSPLPDLVGAWCAVTWGSGAAVKAIVAGVPVFHEFGGWIGAPAARFGVSNIDDCLTGDRGPMLHRLSWAQWSLAEIESGEAFEWLLSSSISSSPIPGAT
jgi:hypothetical protein